MKKDPVFESYLANIKTKTGKTPADFKALAKKKGLLRPGGQSRRNGGLVKAVRSYPGLCPRGLIHHSRIDRHRP